MICALQKMSRAEDLWERLVRAVLRRERTGTDALGRPVGGIAGYVPSSLTNNRDIDEILRAADEIQDVNPAVSRILCEHAYSLAQNLDPNSEGRGVLQFKTGLMSVIKQKLAKREGGTIDRSQDIAQLQEFYKSYRENNNVDKLREEEMQLRESGAFTGILGELERKTVKRKRVFATLKVLGSVLGQLTDELPEELKRMIESDATMTEDLIAYNIIPLDGQTMTNAIVTFPEVRAAATALKYFQGLPQLPDGFPIPATRSLDMLDFLHYIFGFQKDNVSNQREHVVHLLANEQSRLGIPDATEPDAIPRDLALLMFGWVLFAKVVGFVEGLLKWQEEWNRACVVDEAGCGDDCGCATGEYVKRERLFDYLMIASLDVIKSLFVICPRFVQKLDEAAVQKVFLKSLDNYIKWCSYLCIQPVWSNFEDLSKEKKLLFVSLYFLIWGEAANVRFLPECLCYIFHHMVREMDGMLRQQIAQPAKSCDSNSENGVSFLDQVITPLYEVVAAEAGNNDNGRAPHSSWRNYDDFNEYFWSLHCFELSWPWRLTSSFFQRPKPRTKYLLKTAGSQRRGKTSFVEHRTFLHLYHSFHRLWIFLVMMFQGLTVIAFNDGKFNSKTLREILSLGPTFAVMKFIESVLDVIMMYGAYSTSRRLAVTRIFLRFVWFSCASVFLSFLYVKALQEESKQNSNSVFFRLYMIVVGIYAGVQFFISFLMRIPACHHMTNQCDHWPFIRFVKWMRQERYYVGRGMYERTSDFIKYMLFWLVVLSGKFSFAYFLQIKPLVEPTRVIVTMTDNLKYSWHDLVSKNNHNALTVVTLWAPVIAIYLLDIHVFYTIISAIWGFLIGAKDRLGEIRSLEAVHILFEDFPGAFMNNLHIPLPNRHGSVNFLSYPLTRYYGLNCFPSRFHYVFHLKAISPLQKFPQLFKSGVQDTLEKRKIDAVIFGPFWNEIIHNLREEDYVTNLEMELLLMPKNSGNLPLVQWPLFLLASKIFLAKDMVEGSDSQAELWERISRDDYMKYAVEEGYHALRFILTEILEGEGRIWVERVYADIEGSIANRSIHVDFQLKKLSLVITRVTGLLGILKAEKPDQENGAIKAVQDLYDVVQHDVLSVNMREHYETWNLLSKARTEGRLFTNLKWPRDTELKTQIKRLYLLLTIKDSAANVPKNIEARRRLQFFTNSLFMDLPAPKPVREMLSFSVFTPYYSEIVLYSMNELQKKNEDGISTLFYLQKIYPESAKMDCNVGYRGSVAVLEFLVYQSDEWKNFLDRIGCDENAPDSELINNPDDNLELRIWASYRGQTLARTGK
ncbi:hypothetical protein POTOM_003664 [Populus tomentosa]|uniref:1,3-beta-glucan synthase n=1 Tax=Populus tomentosa TaxID=118781 RepID=A0A8X8AFQ5_POPTO|nr:hypothetical protein POTOM_003664 [Populus tomentosa]